MIKNLLRPAMIFVPLGLGMFFPQAACTSFLIRWLLMIMLLMVFLGLSIRDMKLRKSHFIVLLVNLIIGVSCYFAVKFITGDDTLAKAAFFVGITPTATAAAVVMGFLGGNVGYVLTAFVVTNLGIAFVLPPLMGMVCGDTSWGFMLRVLESCAFQLVITYIFSF